MDRVAPWAFALLLLAAIPWRSAEAAAVSDNLALTYEATLIGLPLATVSAVLDAGRPYRITTDLQTRGVVDLFSPWRHRATATGTLSADGGAVVGVRYRGDGVRRSEERYAQLLFEPALTTVEALQPDPMTFSKGRRVPPALRHGTFDPLTAFYILAERLDRGRGCDGPIPIYDGRYRYDLIMSAGPDALSCRFAYRQVAGFSKRKAPFVDASADTPGLIRYARVAAGFPPVPERLEVPSRFGSVVATLTGWSVETRAAAASQ